MMRYFVRNNLQLPVIAVISVITAAGCGQQEKSPPAASDTNDSRKVSQEAESNVVQTKKQPVEKQEQTKSRNQPQAFIPPKLYATEKNLEKSNNKPKVQPVYRPSDNRPRHDDAQLAGMGIHKYESQRLKLYTDIEPDTAKTLPPYVDAAYKALLEYFGPLPPNREKSEFQITGYLMSDQELFRKAALIPSDLPPFVNGRHRELEFWINNQEEDYYLRHLLIHEATHCYMTTTRDPRIAPWYLEGMAELFGTHFTDGTGNTRFGLMPHNKDDFRGLGRITMIQIRIDEGRFKPLGRVTALNAEDYLDNEAYAWSWALCHFLNSHPRYRKRFRELGKLQTPSQLGRGFKEAYRPDLTELKTEWCLFAHGLQDGYDVERNAVQFAPGKPLEPGVPSKPVLISCDHGWQSAALRVQKDKTYEVTATGRFTLAEEPKPWVTEPQGVSIRYFRGRPLGMLLASIRDETATGLQNAGTERDSLLQVIPIGQSAEFKAGFTGTLYFRVNDSFSELADNTGRIRVTVKEIQP